VFGLNIRGSITVLPVASWTMLWESYGPSEPGWRESMTQMMYLPSGDQEPGPADPAKEKRGPAVPSGRINESAPPAYSIHSPFGDQAGSVPEARNLTAPVSRSRIRSPPGDSQRRTSRTSVRWTWSS
jgi:hypothetical protein